jgi:hypothetical protein
MRPTSEVCRSALRTTFAVSACACQVLSALDAELEPKLVPWFR